MTHDIAIVGYGYWGPNLLRTFVNIPGCTVRYCCDLRTEALQEVKRRFPYILTTTDFNEIISDPNIDAVVLATPTESHFALAEKAINSGKDVLIEKPMTCNSEEAWQLVALAEKNKRILMVDHILLFNPAVLKIKELIDSGEIGEILYIDSTRTNLGLFQKDINVIFDLASHEFSILQFILGDMPKVVSVTGKSHVNKQIDVAYITAEYPKNILAHVHITWLSPLKLRRMLIVGSKKMIVYDDNDPSEKVKVYDKGVIKEKSHRDQKQIKIGYRVGDIWSPHIEIADPLMLLAQSFIDAIVTRRVVRSDGKFSAEIIEILESATNFFNKHSLSSIKTKENLNDRKQR
ncbi:MAG: Gfo/Idh/MocA family oxidoreductase [bacterium]|nr:Gfo/Idh/MocA family oxidoreductase [bacterium]